MTALGEWPEIQFGAPTKAGLQNGMLKLAVPLIVAVPLVVGCDAFPKTKRWEYQHSEDALRQKAATTARLESNEWWGDDRGSPEMVLTITRGSAADDGLKMTSDFYNCSQPTLLRVDDQPIETVVSPGHGVCLDLPLDADLAKRIMSSREIVAEIGGPGGPQMTFRTAGLDLSNGQGRP